MKRFVFSSILALLLEKDKISIRSHKLRYLKGEFFLDAKEKGREFIHIYGHERE